MQELTYRRRVWILVGMFVATVIGLLFVPPIRQDPAYHDFADQRLSFGIPNVGDVTSNIGFGIVGLWGLWWLWRHGRTVFAEAVDARPYVLFFIGVTLVTIGSSYYHWAPSNHTLFWDRLPMTVAFMALFSALIADRVDRNFGNRRLLPILIVIGIVSLLYWIWSESVGRGDLRLYAMVQFYPIITLPVLCWLFPKAKYTGGGWLIWVIGWYAFSKVLEHFDHEVYALLGGAVSGHSLKHLAAAVATFMALRMIATTAERAHGAAMAAESTSRAE